MSFFKKSMKIVASVGLLSTVGLGVGVSASLADTFTISSTSFADNGLMDSKYAGKGGPRKCDGDNIAPELSWAHPPEGTKSYAIVVTDAVGGHGLGIVHWVAYGIPVATNGIAEGVGSGDSSEYIGGINVIKKGFYLGPCPDVGDAPHHYEFMLVALDLDVDALKPGLTKDGLFEAIKGHNLAATSFVGRYARNK